MLHVFAAGQVLAREAGPSFMLWLSDEDAARAREAGLAAGDHLMVVDAVSDCFECEVLSFEEGFPRVRIAQHVGAGEDAAPEVVLVQGVAAESRMEAVVRQASELGVRALVPFVCERCDARVAEDADEHVARWRGLAADASLHAGRARAMEVREPMGVRAVCDELVGAAAVLVCWEEAGGGASIGRVLRAAGTAGGASGEVARKAAVADAREAREDAGAAAGSAAEASGGPAPCGFVALVVGPEGGLAQDEVDALLACNAHAAVVSLGPSILGVETASLVAVTLAQHELGRLG